MAEIFVFGSNLAGRHGAGSAKEAVENWGAKYGVGHGPYGASYAIPTKGYKIEILPLDKINKYVKMFLRYAEDNDEHNFNVVAIGCGLAGYKPEQIAPMFANAPSNVKLPPEFVDVLRHRPGE